VWAQCSGPEGGYGWGETSAPRDAGSIGIARGRQGVGWAQRSGPGGEYGWGETSGRELGAGVAVAAVAVGVFGQVLLVLATLRI
jgi:hypothetical protein